MSFHESADIQSHSLETAVAFRAAPKVTDLPFIQYSGSSGTISSFVAMATELALYATKHRLSS